MKITIEVSRERMFWRIVAGNGETLAHSEEYSTGSNAVRAARRMGKQTGWEVVVVS